MKLFHSFDTMDWGRIALIITAVATVWERFVAIIPEKYHHHGTVVLGAILAGVTVMMRSGKSRVEKIVDKIEEHHDDAVKKTAEIKNLINNEVAEKETP